MIRNLINYFCFLFGWYALIEYGNAAAPFVAIYIVCHILAQKTKTRELITLIIVSIIGLANDIFLIHMQVIKFYPTHIFPPFWFITLWPLFASMLNNCLKLFSHFNLAVNIILGAIGGGLSYFGGSKLNNSISINYHLIYIICICWAILFPTFIIIAKKIREYKSK